MIDLNHNSNNINWFKETFKDYINENIESIEDAKKTIEEHQKKINQCTNITIM